METLTDSPTPAQTDHRTQADVRVQELREARDMLCAAVMGIRHGGATARFGRIVRDVAGMKFDTFVPTDLADVLEREDFAKQFGTALRTWADAWSDDVSDATKAARDREARACQAFIADGGHVAVAKAIRTIVRHRAYTWSETTGRNDFPQSLAGACHQLLGINITVARRRRMRTTF